MARFIAGLLLLLLVASFALAQNPPSSDAQPLAFAAKSVTAMTSGTTISDDTLTGTAT